MNKDNFIPLNLQFFADEPEPTNETVDESANESNEPDVTLESLMTEIAKLKADNAKLKNTNDKLCSESGTLRKQLKEKMTAEEQKAEAEAEAAAQKEEEINKLIRYKAVTEATDRYLEMGMSKELAKATAEAEVDGDKETETGNISRFLKEQKEQIEKTIREEYKAQMPTPASGNSGQVDYAEEINKALANGDMNAMALAILNQNEAVVN